MKNKRFLYIIQYILLFIGIYWLTTVIEKVPGFDLHRTYEEAKYYVNNFSVEQLILYRLAKTVDFVYYLIHYYALKADIQLNILTTSIVFIYYCLVIYTIRKVCNVKISNSIMFVILFTVPIIYVISIARNMTAFMFLFCSIVAYYKKQKLLSTLFVFIAVFTHFTTLMYVAVLLLALLLKNKKINDGMVGIVLVLFFIVSFISPSLLSNIFFDVIEGQELSYENYSKVGGMNFLLNSYINYADKVPVTIAYIYSILLLFLNKQKGFEFWSLFILTIMQTFFMNYSFSLTVRCLMFLPVFWGLNAGNIYNFSTNKSRAYLQNFSLVAIFTLLLHIFGYRQIYLAFL